MLIYWLCDCKLFLCSVDVVVILIEISFHNRNFFFLGGEERGWVFLFLVGWCLLPLVCLGVWVCFCFWLGFFCFFLLVCLGFFFFLGGGGGCTFDFCLLRCCFCFLDWFPTSNAERLIVVAVDAVPWPGESGRCVCRGRTRSHRHAGPIARHLKTAGHS